MRKKLLVFITLFYTTFFSILATEQFSGQDYVLIASSYSHYHGWSRELVNQINASLEKKYPDLEVFTEYLTTKCVFAKEDWEKRMNSMFNTYKELPKMLVLIGDEAWIAYRKSAKGVWMDLPVLLVNVHDLTVDYENYQLGCDFMPSTLYPLSNSLYSYNATAVIREDNIKVNIKLMQTLMPKMKKILFISDNTYEGIVARIRFMRWVTTGFPELGYENLGGCHLSTNNLYNRLYLADNTTGVLVNNWYADRDLRSYMNLRLIQSVRTFFPTPIFTSTDDACYSPEQPYLANGYFYKVSDYAERANELIGRILSGENPREIPISGPANKPLVHLDKTEMDYFNINASLFPQQTELYNVPQTFYDRYKHSIMLAGSLFFVLLSALSIFLFLWLRTKREKKLKDKLHQEYERVNRKLKLILSVSKLIPFNLDVEKRQLSFDIASDHPLNLVINNPQQTISFQQMMNYLSPEQQKVVNQAMDKLQTRETTNVCFNLKVLDKYKMPIWLEINAVTESYAADGRPERVIGSLLNVSEWREYPENHYC